MFPFGAAAADGLVVFFFLNGWKEVEPRFVFEMQP